MESIFEFLRLIIVSILTVLMFLCLGVAIWGIKKLIDYEKHSKR